MKDSHYVRPRFLSRPLFLLRRSSGNKVALSGCAHKKIRFERTPQNYALRRCSEFETVCTVGCS